MQRGLLTTILLIAALASCGDDSGEASEGRLQVVASFYPIAEAAERVGGDAVEVTNLTAAGTEPHDIELTPDQVDLLEDADVVLYLGQGFQPAIEEVVEGREGATIDVSAGLALEEGAADEHRDEEGELEGEEDEHVEGGLDPHFWLDPVLFAHAVDRIEGALADESPDDAAAFASNADDYRTQLEALDSDFADGLGQCERDDVVTSHAAFHYLAERYGLTQHAIAGISPESEPDPGRIAELSDLIEAEGVTTVFSETLLPADLAETLAREAHVNSAVLNPIEGLSEDEVAAGETYDSVMRENLAALRDALGCG